MRRSEATAVWSGVGWLTTTLPFSGLGFDVVQPPRTGENFAVRRLRIQIEYACIHSEYAPAGRQPLTRWRRELDRLKGNGVS